MKKVYEAPLCEVEYYSLDTSIASNCNTVVKIGTDCEGYVDPFTMTQSTKVAPPYNVLIGSDDEACDCYTTGNGQYWQS